MNDQLARKRNEPTEIVKGSERLLSGAMVALMLDLAATITGYKELTPREQDFWLEKLERFQPEAIKAAFEKYLETEVFFPKPAQILELLIGNTNHFAERELAETVRQMEENRQARERLQAEGLPSGIDQYQSLMKRAEDSIKHMPDCPWMTDAARNEMKEKVKKWQSTKGL